jgi:hypothetical protein
MAKIKKGDKIGYRRATPPAQKIETPITQEEVLDLMIRRNLTIEKVIDASIDGNGIIGVGLITLGDYLKNYLYGHPQRRFSKKIELTKDQIELLKLIIKKEDKNGN